MTSAGELFVYATPTSRRVACVVCGAKGYPLPLWPGSWQINHLRGHAPCGTGCGRMLVLCRDGSPRIHTRCPNRPRYPLPESIAEEAS